MKECVWIINQYASTPATGVGGRHFYLARELSKQGYKVYLVVSANHHLLRSKPELNTAYYCEQCDGFSVIWVRMPDYKEAHSRKRALSWFIFPWRLQGLQRVIPDAPDTILVSSPSLFSFLGGRRLAKKLTARLVFEVRDIWPLTLVELGGYSKNHPFIKLMQWIEDEAYRVSDAVISNLKNSVEHMVSRGLSRGKFSWIPNGFSRDEVDLRVEINSGTSKRIPRNKFIIGYAGTLGVANALDTLILSAEKLVEYKEIAFVLVGDGKEKNNLKRLVNDKGLNNVFFLDSIPKLEIQSMLSYFDVCYIGLTNDPLFRFGVSPNKLFDYMYSAKPIIYAIDSGDYKPVEAASAGIQVPAEDPEALSKAIVDIYGKTEEERRLMGLNARRAAENEYEYGALSIKLSGVLFPDD